MRSPFSITSVANTPLPWISERRASIFFGFFFQGLSALLLAIVRCIWLGRIHCGASRRDVPSRGRNVGGGRVALGPARQKSTISVLISPGSPMLRVTRLTDYATVVLTVL